MSNSQLVATDTLKRGSRKLISLSNYLRPISPNALTESLWRAIQVKYHEFDRLCDKDVLDTLTRAWLEREKATLKDLVWSDYSLAKKKIPVLLQVQEFLQVDQDSSAYGESVEDLVSQSIKHYENKLTCFSLMISGSVFFLASGSVGLGIFFSNTSIGLLSPAFSGVASALVAGAFCAFFVALLLDKLQKKSHMQLDSLQGLEALKPFYDRVEPLQGVQNRIVNLSREEINRLSNVIWGNDWRMPQNSKLTNYKTAYKAAIASGDIAQVDFVCYSTLYSPSEREILGFDTVPEAGDIIQDCYVIAARSGHVNMLRRLDSICQYEGESLLRFHGRAVSAANSSNDSDRVHRLWHLDRERSEIIGFHKQAALLAIQHGHVEAFNYCKYAITEGENENGRDLLSGNKWIEFCRQFYSEGDHELAGSLHLVLLAACREVSCFTLGEGVFEMALEKGDLEALSFLRDGGYSPLNMSEKASRFSLLAVQSNDNALIDFMFDLSNAVFESAIVHYRENDSFAHQVNRYITNKYQYFIEKRATIQEGGERFDFSCVKEKNRYLAILRFLIRYNPEGAGDKIRQLISVPSIRQSLPNSFPGCSSVHAYYWLARNSHNQEALTILRTITSVENYHQQYIFGRATLRATRASRRSSGMSVSHNAALQLLAQNVLGSLGRGGSYVEPFLEEYNHQLNDTDRRLNNLDRELQIWGQNVNHSSRRSNPTSLRAVARNRESAMQPLKPGEEKYLNSFIAYYQKRCNTPKAINALVDKTRDKLADMVHKNPPKAEIVCGQYTLTIRLPLEWNAFQSLELSKEICEAVRVAGKDTPIDESMRDIVLDDIILNQSVSVGDLLLVERKAMLRAYHAHEAHSAWRFFLPENPWIDPDQPGWALRRGEREPYTYSSHFEKFTQLIAVYYCLAEDARDFWWMLKEAYFLMMRAHNFDRTICDEKTNQVGQYNDVAQSDRTSCSLGIKRRFFNAISSMARQGKHQLDRNTLNKPGLFGELKAFFLNYVKAKLTSGHRDTLKEALDDEIFMCENASDDVLKLESDLPEKVAAFKRELKRRVGEDFTSELEKLFDEYFEADEGKSVLAKHYDVVQHLFEEPVPTSGGGGAKP